MKGKIPANSSPNLRHKLTHTWPGDIIQMINCHRHRPLCSQGWFMAQVWKWIEKEIFQCSHLKPKLLGLVGAVFKRLRCLSFVEVVHINQNDMALKNFFIKQGGNIWVWHRTVVQVRSFFPVLVFVEHRTQKEAPGHLSTPLLRFLSASCLWGLSRKWKLSLISCLIESGQRFSSLSTQKYLKETKVVCQHRWVVL